MSQGNLGNAPLHQMGSHVPRMNAGHATSALNTGGKNEMAQAWRVSYLAESTFLIGQISWVSSRKSPKIAAFNSSSARLYISRVWLHMGSLGKEMGPEIHMLLLLQELIKSHQSLPAQSGVGSKGKQSFKIGMECTSFSF